MGVAAALFTLTACQSDHFEPSPEGSVALEAFTVELADTEQNGAQVAQGQTRALPQYSLNTDLDPTKKNNVVKRGESGDWRLYAEILAPADPEAGNLGRVYKTTCTYSSGQKMWLPNPADDIHLPNYIRRSVKAVLYPDGWTEGDPIVTDQSNESVFLLQDILDQPSQEHLPAHILSLKVSHSYSMLDIVLGGIDPDEISSLTVETPDGQGGTVSYTPYEVDRDDVWEHLLILPLGVVNPKVIIKTVDGAVYYQTLTIQGGTKRNTCYCVTFRGLALELKAYSIDNWTIGGAHDGNYTTVTSYPTFKGLPGATVELHYDNDLVQEITFNRDGETTQRPLGRTIDKIIYNGVNILGDGNEIILREMSVDLTGYFI